MENILFNLLHPEIALANNYDSGYVDALGKSAGLNTTNTTTIEETVAFFITILLGFVGIILLVITIKAGALWMTAQGDKKIIDNSKKTIIGSAIGLFLILSSYSLSEFVIQSINQAAQNNFNQVATTTPTGSGGFSQTVCESNSQCPTDAPFCTDKAFYTAQLGYCNCCNNDIPERKCDNETTRHSYCQQTYGSNFKCKNIGNGINTSCMQE